MPLTTNYGVLAESVDLSAVDAYVHVGQGIDDLLYYLTRTDGEDSHYGFVHTGDRTVAVVPPRYVREATESFPGDDVVQIAPDSTAIETVAGLLDDEPTVRVPETMAVGLVDDLRETATVEVVPEPDTVWCLKNDDETELLRRIAGGVQHGIARAETVLAESTIDGDRLYWEDERVTTDVLRREIRKALADHDLSDHDTIIVGAGESCADLHFTGHDTVDPHEPVLIDLGPRHASGYYGDITRTFVPGEPSAWVRDAYAAVEAALSAAFETLSDGAGVTAGELYGSMAETLESHGYETGVPETADDVAGLTHGTGHGIGVRIHEKPFQTPDSEVVLEAGNVFTIEPGVYHPDRGGVRLEDVVRLESDGFENFMEYPLEITPTTREPPLGFLD